MASRGSMPIKSKAEIQVREISLKCVHGLVSDYYSLCKATFDALPCSLSRMSF